MYGELMIGINMLFNYAILSFTNKVGNHRTSTRRLWGAAFIGAFFVTLFPNSLPAIIFTFLGMTYSAFGQTFGSWKNSLLAVLIAALFAGGLLTLLYSRIDVGANQHFLFIAIGLAYLSLSIVKHKWIDTRLDNKLMNYTFDSELLLWGLTVPLKVFIDTGNHCIEPLSGSPVHFVGHAAIREQLPQDFASVLENWNPGRSPDLSGFPDRYQKRLRLIRLQTVQGNSWAVGIKYDSWTVNGNYLPEGYIVVTKLQKHYPQGASAIMQAGTLDVLIGEGGTATC